MAGRWEPMLERLVDERYPRLLARAMLLVATSQDAEDLVQDALVSSFGGRARFGSVAEAEQYVRKAITSRFVDRARRSTRERAALTRMAALPVVEVTDALPGVAGDLRDALAQLPPRQRACVVLRHMDDLSVRETAALLGVSEGAVKRYVADGVAALNRILGTTTSGTADEPVRLVPTAEVRRDA